MKSTNKPDISMAYNKLSDCLYIMFTKIRRGGFVSTYEIGSGVLVDVHANGQLHGIEIIGVKRLLKGLARANERGI